MSCTMEKKKLYEQQIREESITQSTVYQLISTPESDEEPKNTSNHHSSTRTMVI